MKTTEETIYRESQESENQAMEQEAKNQKSSRWQTVSIGGVAGIAMGAAGAYAMKDDVPVEEVTEEANENTADAVDAEVQDVTEVPHVGEVQMATVDQSLSFADAFDAARAGVGSGGVFVWHGQLYNTFTADEWANMSDAEKNEFADEAAPYVPQPTHQTQQVQHTTTTTTEEETNETEEEETSDMPEVHFLGVSTGTSEDGQTVNIGHMTVEGVNVALVDVDNDQVFDVQWVDANQNMSVEEDEIQDISDTELSVDTFRTLSELEEMSGDGQLEQASHVQEDLAPDMPDYMNDADVNLV
ncbi:MAG: hypothetical protein IJT97_04085 [Bacteroidaceae bacterium]|nr:hypothetical protein [Bacteroidaceae bacterium]